MNARTVRCAAWCSFFKDLGQLTFSLSIPFRVCLSSRPYPYIRIDKAIPLVLEDQEGHRQDMANYVASELKAGSSKMVEQIRAEILERASGIFLWIVLVVRELNEEFDRGRIHALRNRLDEIPDEMDRLFQDILTRDTKNIDEVVLCLQWILFSRRPLEQKELYFAVLSGVSPGKLSPWNSKEVTQEDMARFLLNSSKGLAATTKSQSQTVQFIHESVRDFLLKENGLGKLRPYLRNNLTGLGHHGLKKCCQAYLKIDIPRYLFLSDGLFYAKSERRKNLRKIVSEKLPFLEYAVHNVLHHADTASAYGVSQIEFVENFPLSRWITQSNFFEEHQNCHYTPNASVLYILAENDISSLIPVQLNRDPHVDIGGERYQSPIHTAVIHGNESAVRALLECGVDVNSKDLNGRTPLWFAIEKWHDAIVELQLMRGNIDIISIEKNGMTPLYQAVVFGHTAILKLLFERDDIDINSIDKNGMTPLYQAVVFGHTAIVKLLLERDDVDINLKDKSGMRPLHQAARLKHDTIVKLLFEREDIDVNSKDEYSMTPLYQAALFGHTAIVKLLLERDDVDINPKTEYGQTPLSVAVVENYREIVKLLLERDDVDVNSKDEYGMTPLYQAVVFGHTAIVKLLFERDDIDVNPETQYSETPLLAAVTKNYEGIVKLLLERDDVDIHSADFLGRTPLSIAKAGNNTTILNLLLERDGKKSEEQGLVAPLNNTDEEVSTPMLYLRS